MVIGIALFTLFVCAVTDVTIRRTSELLIGLASLAILLIHFSWWSICVGVLLSLPYLIGLLKKKEVGLGDVEMSFFLGVGFGMWGFVISLFASILVLFTKRWWNRLSTRHTPKEERHLAPLGFYYAIAAFGVSAVQISFF